MLSLGVAASLLSVTSANAAANYKGEAFKGYKGEVKTCETCRTLADGFYLGGAAGYDSYNMHATNSVVVPGDVSLSNSQHNNSTGWVGGIFGGYGQSFGKMYYLGGELFLNTSGASNSESVNVTPAGAAVANAISKESVTTSFGAFVLPGIKVNPASLAYVRLGYSRAYIKQQFSRNSVSTNRNQWSNGFAYGVGMEEAICENWSLRGDFTHVNYSSISSSTTTAGSTATAKLSPSDNQFLLGLSYHFS